MLSFPRAFLIALCLCSEPAIYYGALPDHGNSALSNISIVANRGPPAIVIMANIEWSCQPGYWAPAAGESFGVGNVQDCHDEINKQVRRLSNQTPPTQRPHCSHAPTRCAPLLSRLPDCMTWLRFAL